MDHVFLIIMLISLLNSYHCRPLRSKRKYYTDFPTVRFSINGHQFQMGLLTMPKIENDQVTEPVAQTETFTQFALLNILPKTSLRPEVKPGITGKINEPVWNKVKSLYNELGDMLQLHEKELESLMKNQESPKSAVAVNTSSGDTSVRVKINNDNCKQDVLEKPNVLPTESRLNNEDPSSLNVHVHAEPPLNMRTIIGYPKSSRNIDSIKNILRLYNRETLYPVTQQDSPYELNTQSSEEVTFLRRGSELLLNWWKRFKAQKIKNKSQDLEP